MKETVYLDIMLGGRFYCQLRYEYCPLFPVEERDVEDYVLSKRPSLKGKNFIINFSSNKV